jgi:hypothetical protein
MFNGSGESQPTNGSQRILTISKLQKSVMRCRTCELLLTYTIWTWSWHMYLSVVLWERIRTDHKTIFRVPHRSRPHGHDRNLSMCVNDLVCWQSTPVLHSTCDTVTGRGPVGLSLVVTETHHRATSPAPNSELEPTGVLQVHSVLLVQRSPSSWSRVGYTVVGILPFSIWF